MIKWKVKLGETVKIMTKKINVHQGLLHSVCPKAEARAKKMYVNMNLLCIMYMNYAKSLWKKPLEMLQSFS